MANLLFSTGFEGNVSLSAPSNVTGGNGWQNFTGSDTGSSFNGSFWGGSAAVQLRGMRGDVYGVSSKGIQTTEGPDGGQTRALNLGVNQDGGDWTQSPLLIQPRNSPDEFYISQDVKLPSNLGSILGSEGWLAAFGEWKSAGDFRVVSNVSINSQGNPYWTMKWDTDANGNVGWQTFFSGENRNVEVPLGEWMHVEFYTKRGDGDGRVWLKVNGETVFDRSGDTVGENNAPIDRIFVSSSYANRPVDVLVDNIQVWDGVPSAGGTRLPAPQATAAPPGASGSGVNGTGGSDLLAGTGAGEVIRGGGGHDILIGGGGADVFTFARGDGYDWIADFASGTDKLRLTGMSQSDVSWGNSTWQGVGSGIEVRYDNGASGGVFLPNVTSLGWGDIILG